MKIEGYFLQRAQARMRRLTDVDPDALRDRLACRAAAFDGVDSFDLAVLRRLLDLERQVEDLKAELADQPATQTTLLLPFTAAHEEAPCSTVVAFAS